MKEDFFFVENSKSQKNDFSWVFTERVTYTHTHIYIDIYIEINKAYKKSGLLEAKEWMTVFFTEVFRRKPDNSASYVKYASHQSLEGALYLLPTIIYPCLDMSVDWIVKEYKQGKMLKEIK